MWYCCVWQGVTQVKWTEVGDSTADERLCGPTAVDTMCLTQTPSSVMLSYMCCIVHVLHAAVATRVMVYCVLH